MRMIGWLPVVLTIVVLPLVMGQGCPSASQQQLSAEDLTAEEQAAIKSAVESAAALSQAAAVTQSAANTSEAGSSVRAGTVSVGQCPAVTTAVAGSLGAGLAVDLTIDFGTSGCTPVIFPGVTCSGSATGSLSASHAIAVTFNSIGCGTYTLGGQGDLAFGISEGTVDLNGSLDLTWAYDGGGLTVSGEGQLGYDRPDITTTIDQFSGSMTDSTGTYTTEWADVIVSFWSNVSFIPSAGTISIGGPAIRSLTVRFNENSPINYEAEVSIAGGPYFTVGLSEL